MIRDNFRYKYVQLTEERYRQLIFDLIIKKTEAAQFYIQLLNNSPSVFVSRILEGIRLNDLIDLDKYKQLYIDCFGRVPDFTVEQKGVSDFREAILTAIQNEINAIDNIRKFLELTLTEDQLEAGDLFRATLLLDIEKLSLLAIIFNTL